LTCQPIELRTDSRHYHTAPCPTEDFRLQRLVYLLNLIVIH
jgi:hypothetical protein